MQSLRFDPYTLRTSCHGELSKELLFRDSPLQSNNEKSAREEKDKEHQKTNKPDSKLCYKKSDYKRSYSA